MDAHIYILYSKSIDKFYIGSTSLEPSDRLAFHLSQKYGGTKYTALANDWQVYFQHLCNDISQARQIEAHIKKMKSRKYLSDLKRFPEMITKLLKRFPGSSR